MAPDLGERLAGGVANAGRVVRVGTVVTRPARPSTPLVHRLLRFVRERGFDGVPQPLDVVDGTERLRFIEGEVPLAPVPSWWKDEQVLASTAGLLRRFHDATVGFVAAEERGWSSELADPQGGEVICHNDVCPENVVYRAGRAVALLDFDHAAPGRRVYDVAQLAKMCCPLDIPEAARRRGMGDLDPFSRLRVVADGYGMALDRPALVDALEVAVAVGDRYVRRHVAAGEPGFVAMWEQVGGQPRLDERRAWLADNRERFLAALG